MNHRRSLAFIALLSDFECKVTDYFPCAFSHWLAILHTKFMVEALRGRSCGTATERGSCPFVASVTIIEKNNPNFLMTDLE